MKTICLDYDGTYTKFPELLDIIIDKQLELNYAVVLCTMRFKHEEDEVLKNLSNRIDIYYSGRKAKRPFMEYTLGINIDVWVDDNPHWINEDSI